MDIRSGVEAMRFIFISLLPAFARQMSQLETQRNFTWLRAGGLLLQANKARVILRSVRNVRISVYRGHFLRSTFFSDAVWTSPIGTLNRKWSFFRHNHWLCQGSDIPQTPLAMCGFDLVRYASDVAGSRIFSKYDCFCLIFSRYGHSTVG